MLGIGKLHWAIRWLVPAVILILAGVLAGEVVSRSLLRTSHVGAAPSSTTSRTPLSPTALPVMPTPDSPTRALLIGSQGRGAPNGAWIPARAAWLRVELAAPRTSITVRVEAQVAPASLPFTRTISARSGLVYQIAGHTSQARIRLPRLVDGYRYHWRVRAVSVGGKVSLWSGGGVFGASSVLPPPPRLVAGTVTIGGWSRAVLAQFRWGERGSRVPITAYQYVVVRGETGPVPTHLLWRPTSRSVRLPHLADGRWRLLARVVNAAGIRSHPAVWPFGLARHVAAPRLVAAIPGQGSLRNTRIPTLRWKAAASRVPVRGYEYALLPPHAHSLATPTWTFTRASSLSFPSLADGAWLVRVRAVDVANNRSPALQWSFRLDRRPPALGAPVLSAASFTPAVERLGISFSLSKSARVSFSLARPGTKWSAPLAVGGSFGPGSHQLHWDGHVGRRLAPAGKYQIIVHTVDAAGNHGQLATIPVTVLTKWILISLKTETLRAYQGSRLIYQTAVTTGGPDTRTPTGIFHVEGKYLGWVFHSPWPRSSPLWYPDSPSNFALLYEATDGYFVHDAPWRTRYGPGSNATAGTPGGSTTGSHGCTNVPYAAMAQIFAWADVGTPIRIV